MKSGQTKGDIETFTWETDLARVVPQLATSYCVQHAYLIVSDAQWNQHSCMLLWILQTDAKFCVFLKLLNRFSLILLAKQLFQIDLTEISLKQHQRLMNLNRTIHADCIKSGSLAKSYFKL